MLRNAMRVFAAVLAVSAAACTSSPARHRAATTTQAPSSTTAPISTTTTSLPAGAAVSAGFQPASVSFVSGSIGYVLGVAPGCGDLSCAVVARTTNGGASWVALPATGAHYLAPPAQANGTASSVSELRFADPLDGWLFGPALLSTHDGGASWQSIDVNGSVVSLEATGGQGGEVVAVVSPCSPGVVCTGALRLMTASVASGPFSQVAVGPSGQSTGLVGDALALHAPAGFALLASPLPGSPAALFATGDLVGTSGWKAFPDPCAATGLELTSFVAPDALRLYTLCSGNGAAGSTSKVVVLTEAGRSNAVGTAPSGGDGGIVAVSPNGVLIIASASGASWLYRSSDAGRQWATVEAYGDGGVGFTDLGFTTANQGVVIHGLPRPNAAQAAQLLMTHDAGASWQPVTFG